MNQMIYENENLKEEKNKLKNNEKGYIKIERILK